MRVFRPRSEPILPDKSLVVFFCSASEAELLDIASGPFTPRVGPRGGRVKPLASVHSQHYGDTLEHLAVLYSVISGRPAEEALVDARRDPPAVLARLADPFVHALAAIGAPQREGQDLWAIYDKFAAAWLQAVRWRPEMQVGGLAMRIFHDAHECRRGLEKGLPVWAWHGKRAPEYVIAHGVGQDSYEAYRKQKH
jgi:hypothetical protein